MCDESEWVLVICTRS